MGKFILAKNLGPDLQINSILRTPLLLNLADTEMGKQEYHCLNKHILFFILVILGQAGLALLQKLAKHVPVHNELEYNKVIGLLVSSTNI